MGSITNIDIRQECSVYNLWGKVLIFIVGDAELKVVHVILANEVMEVMWGSGRDGQISKKIYIRY